MRLAI